MKVSSTHQHIVHPPVYSCIHAAYL
ncbi:hypothetical protein CIB84_009268 [Bambusicola thoracicus]|uniref:Uncharacterized protein n=1 Tax=Bambusicola thoracicus TaxID=9083 RepID=A0A2P4SS89_BAMTH|nr:hypothetical protein CIB84_009268 [Bambusicola thoracicus]